MHFRRRLKTMAVADLVPMIDVVFQLVIFFMVSSTFVLTPGIDLNLPESATAEKLVMTKLVVSVFSEDEIYLNKDRYSLGELSGALSDIEAAEDEEIRSVVVEGDKNIPYQLLIQVLDVLRRNGFRGINLKTREVSE
jgi:biopolymer transport protein ExbD